MSLVKAIEILERIYKTRVVGIQYEDGSMLSFNFWLQDGRKMYRRLSLSD